MVNIDAQQRNRPDYDIKHILRNNEKSVCDVINHFMLACTRKGIEMPTSPEPWHRIIRDSVHMANAPISLERVMFSSESYPRSREVDEWLNILVISGCVHVPSPQFKEYNLDKGVMELWSREFESAPQNYKEFIDEISEKARIEFKEFKTRRY